MPRTQTESAPPKRKAASPSKANAQSAAERREAEAQLRELVADLASAHARLFDSVRRSLQKRLPTAHEVAYEYTDAVVVSYSPSGHGYEGVLAIRASAEGIALYFNRGKELSDPDRLLKGSGKQARWIPVEAASTLARPAVARWIEAAIAGSPVPFARTGRGPVVVRSTAAKRRRQR